MPREPRFHRGRLQAGGAQGQGAAARREPSAPLPDGAEDPRDGARAPVQGGFLVRDERNAAPGRPCWPTLPGSKSRRERTRLFPERHREEERVTDGKDEAELTRTGRPSSTL
mmetsp:Transcript_32513/g.55641  ORF Transcript_32513/g.55641 Transcript_32513/m.55641 type:complete len:112 (+) Transcript_32513:427-762(+)